MREVLAASRPFSWVNTAYPFAAGWLLGLLFACGCTRPA